MKTSPICKLRWHASASATDILRSTMKELATAEHWPGIPMDPDNTPYQLTIDGRVEVANPDDFPFITKGTPPGYKPSGLPKFHTQS